MDRCEDYPCCGHEDGGCPNRDGSFNCARCGRKMPKNSPSAVCKRCHRDWQRQWARGEDDLSDPYDHIG